MPDSNSANTLRPLKVMLVVSSYLPNIGGLQTVTSRLAVGLQQRGHQVQVVAQRYPRHLADYEQIEGIPVTRLMFLFPRFGQILAGRFDLFLAGLWYLPFTLIQLLRQIAQLRPDIVNLHFVGAPTLFVLIAHRLMPFYLVVSLHGDDVEGLPRGTRFDRWLFRSILREADRMTTCSRYLLERAQAIEPTIQGKAQVVYNGVELMAKISGATTGDDLLAVGRLVPSKGFDILLQALALMPAQPMHARLIGDGPEMARLKALAEKLHINERVEFCGQRDRSFTFAAMRSSRIIIVPSRKETFGMTALEGMAAGKPIVATRVGGLLELLQDADATLIEPDDPSALAEAILAGLRRIDNDSTFGERNHLLAAQFSIGRMVSSYLEIYRMEKVNSCVIS